ncbi:unnamed protein product, partial [Mesorhabditis belari]|uniref:Uncharacterized protein n=1 Tax=Mesorhabditis belari TaxID=2138241 RepID=A0AAF3FEJ1_9BILA
MRFRLLFIFSFYLIALTAIKPLPIRRNEAFCVNQKFGNLLYLGPAKTMTTMMARIHCEIETLKKRGHIGPGESDKLNHNNYCFGKQKDEMVMTAFTAPLNGWAGHKRFFIWRDPLDRFLSLYGHMCKREHLCGVAGKNIHSFARGVYQMLKSNRGGPGSKDFLRFKHHVIPQSWYCEISTHRKSDRVVEYTNDKALMMKRLARVFQSSTVPKWMWKKALQRIAKTNINHRSQISHHEQYELWRRQILASPETLAYFKAIYHSDYSLFHKSPPGPGSLRSQRRRNWRHIRVRDTSDVS